MKIDGADEPKPIIDLHGKKKKKKPLKRKRAEPYLVASSPEEKHAKIVTYRNEIDSLVSFCKGLIVENRGALLENVEKVESASLNSVIACLMEESDLPLSKLVDDIFERVKSRVGNGDTVSRASVKSTVLLIGQRSSYGVAIADADVLEDDAESALWFWETRDLKLVPKSVRGLLKVRRICRKKIQERIMSVLVMIKVLERSEHDEGRLQELMKASEKLSKVLNEADIRCLMVKSGAEMAEKEAKKGERELIKRMEKSKREKEKERKKMDRELQKEKLQSEKELKRLHEESLKEERRREKEENDMQKQLKKQREEAEKDQKRKEKEEAELKKQLALQKQASLMNRFLTRNKNGSSSQNDSSMNHATTSGSSANTQQMPKSVTLSMDSILAQNGGIEIEDIWKSYLNAWQSIGRSMPSKRKMHWGVRQKPKTELVKELKLTTNKEISYDDEMNIDNRDGILSQTSTDYSPVTSGKTKIRHKQLLQFDKSYRPGFYGVWPKKSQVVGGRHPFVKDPDIDYEVDSDEEWEEDEPGESLSDCDKDEEDEILGGLLKDADDEDESEDGFFVPDGYLSENEGVNADEMKSEDKAGEVKNEPNSEQQAKSEEFCMLLRQQKYLNNLTEHALKKNQPLIILNLMHEKTTLLSAEGLTGAEKLERICLQALSIHPMPGFPHLDISTHDDVVDEDQEASPTKSGTKAVATAASILDSELPQIISTIQSCSNNIGLITKSLHDKFPALSKSQLRNKVHEISEFTDNRWQVKKEILSKHGLSMSSEKSSGKTRSIASFLKRCLPPSGNTMNSTETSSESSKRHAAEMLSNSTRKCSRATARWPTQT